MSEAERTEEWSQGLFECCKEGCGRCFTLCCCASCAYGRAMEILLQGNCVVCCLFGACCMCCNRGKIRDNYSIKGSGCDDCLVWLFCAPCSVIQTVAEVQKRNTKTIGC